jgi:hypothetical protein
MAMAKGNSIYVNFCELFPRILFGTFICSIYKCKYASNNVISNYTIVDSILDINGSVEVGKKENPMTIIVRGDFIIEELSNDRMVLKENGYDLIYEQNRYGEPKVWYETHGIYTLKKVSDKRD